jgi:hypothetical protein
MSALVQNGVVIYLYDGDAPVLHPSVELVDDSSVAGIAVGWFYDGTSFSPPPPPPPPGVADLLAYASAKQNLILSQVWTFNVGTPQSPVNITTKLDASGALAMLKVFGWVQLNSSNSAATLSYSNVDLSGVTLSLAQASSLASQAAAIDMASYAALNAVAAATSANPPTITTFAQIDAAAWPANG